MSGAAPSGMPRGALWAAVHEALDARRDPLDDPSVIAALEADPAALAEFAALRAGLRALPAAAPARRRLLPFALALAAAAALLVLAGPWSRGEAMPRPAAPQAEAPREAASGPAADSPAAPQRGCVLLAHNRSVRVSAAASSPGMLDHRLTVSQYRP